MSARHSSDRAHGSIKDAGLTAGDLLVMCFEEAESLLGLVRAQAWRLTRCSSCSSSAGVHVSTAPTHLAVATDTDMRAAPAPAVSAADAPDPPAGPSVLVSSLFVLVSE